MHLGETHKRRDGFYVWDDRRRNPTQCTHKDINTFYKKSSFQDSVIEIRNGKRLCWWTSWTETILEGAEESSESEISDVM